MIATVEIDKLGRFVVPKKIRDAAGLHTGDQLEIELRNDEVVLRHAHQPRGLYMVDGWPVYDSGGPPITADEVNRWIAESRDWQLQHASGNHSK